MLITGDKLIKNKLLISPVTLENYVILYFPSQNEKDIKIEVKLRELGGIVGKLNYDFQISNFKNGEFIGTENKYIEQEEKRKRKDIKRKRYGAEKA